MMELTEKYLDSLTLVADFWIANNQNDVVSFENEGIAIEKSKIYLHKYHIDIIVKTQHYGTMELFAKDWAKKHPKAVITKGTKRVEAYELKFLKAEEKKNYTVLKFVGELMK